MSWRVSYNWSELFNKPATLSPCVDLLAPASNCSDFILTQCPTQTHPAQTRCVVRNSNLLSQDLWKIEGDAAAFSQKIRISNAGANAKKITVLIWWTDSLGLHKSAITRALEK